MNNFDNCLSFHIASGAFMGRFIRLNEVLNTILKKHQYPESVSAVIAECTVLGAMLSSTLKYEGLFTLQIQGNGPISMVVVDVTSEGKIRACANFDEEHLKQAQALRKKSGEIEEAPHLLEEGHLAFTVDQGPDTELYQGIVDLQGKTLREIALRYFKQSEQIDTDLKLFLHSPQGDSKSWLAGGIMLQKIPVKGGKELSAEEQSEAWNQAKIFLESLQGDEVFDNSLSSEDILHRLYHADSLAINNVKSYQFGCRCSREKLQATLSSFSEAEINELLKDGCITAQCHFCSEEYSFKKGELVKH